MLPFLPVLILLLLQGPSNIERLAVEGRLPAGLQAIHQQLDRPEEINHRVLASLIVASGDPNLQDALSALLMPSRPVRTEPVPTEAEASSIPAADFGGSGRLLEGYARSARVRDGPIVLV